MIKQLLNKKKIIIFIHRCNENGIFRQKNHLDSFGTGIGKLNFFGTGIGTGFPKFPVPEISREFFLGKRDGNQENF